MAWYVVDDDGYISGPYSTKRSARQSLGVIEKTRKMGYGHYEMRLEDGYVSVISTESVPYKVMAPSFPR